MDDDVDYVDVGQFLHLSTTTVGLMLETGLLPGATLKTLSTGKTRRRKITCHVIFRRWHTKCIDQVGIGKVIHLK